MKTLRGALCGAMLIALHQAGTGVGFPAQALKHLPPTPKRSRSSMLCDRIFSRRSCETPPIARRAGPRGLPARPGDSRAGCRRRRRFDHPSAPVWHLVYEGAARVRARPRRTGPTPEAALRALAPRIEDFATAVATPGTNDRIRFARRVVERKGIDPLTESGKTELRRYLEERTRIVGGSIQSSRLLNPATGVSDKLTLFRERGLSTDTSVFIDFGIEQALDAMKVAGALRAGSVRRVAIVGPGLDFTDKLEGYDFYPEQTIQPFALIDSLLRLELADSADLNVAAFDVSPGVCSTSMTPVREHVRHRAIRSCCRETLTGRGVPNS